MESVILDLAYLLMRFHVLERIIRNPFIKQAQHEDLCVADRAVIWKQCTKNYRKLSLNSVKSERSLLIARQRRKR